jgi:hypothetical protein
MSAPSFGGHPASNLLYEASRSARRGEPEPALEHLATCAPCSEELVHRESFEQPEPLSPGQLEAAWSRFGPRRETPRSPFPARAFALAAASLFVAVALAFRFFGGAAEGPYRGQPEPLELVSPEGPLSEPPREFVTRGGVSSAMRVGVFDGMQSYVWTSEPAQTNRVRFPEEERRKLLAGVDYYWTVFIDDEPLPAKGFRLGSSP